MDGSLPWAATGNALGAFALEDLDDLLAQFPDPVPPPDIPLPSIPRCPLSYRVPTDAPTATIHERQIRDLFHSFFFKHSIVRQQTESFDYFMEVMMPAIIRETQRVEVLAKKQQTKHVITFSNVVVCKPMFKENDGTVHPIDPVECMARRATYSSSVLVDVTHTMYERRPKTVRVAAPVAALPAVAAPTAPLAAMLSAPLSREEEEMRDEEVKMDEDRDPAAPSGLTAPGGSIGVVPGDPAEDYEDVLCEARVYKQYTLYRQPVMVGSKYCHTFSHTHAGICPYVPGGYFLINGNEKVVLPQEKLRNNYFYVTHDKSGKHLYKGEIRSWHESKIRATSTLHAYLSCSRGGTLPSITLDVPFIFTSLPLPQVFRLIGVANTWEMRRYILARHDYTREHPFDHYIRSILKDEQSDLPLDELKVQVAKKGIKEPLKKGVAEPTKEKRIRSVDNIFHNEFLPHMGLDRTDATQQKKALFLGYMVMKLLRIYHGEQDPDDRDDYANKRLDPVHMLFSLLLRQLIRAFHKTFTSQIHKAAENEKHIFVIDMMKNSKRITAGFRGALSSGNWGTSKTTTTQTGVAQPLTRMTPISTICHLRRTNTPINRDGKMSQPRQLHLSAWGLSCVTGDTVVLLADQLTQSPIRDVGLQAITTVHRQTLANEPSALTRFFSQACPRLLKLTTVSGRTLRCTPDHRILIAHPDGKNVMVRADQLQPGDEVFIQHLPRFAPPDEDYGLRPTTPCLLEWAQARRSIQHCYPPVPPVLDEPTMQQWARLVGAWWAVGTTRGTADDPFTFTLQVALDDPEGLPALETDAQELGLSTARLASHILSFRNLSAQILVELGCTRAAGLPPWILRGTANLQREFLGALYGAWGRSLRREASGVALAPLVWRIRRAGPMPVFLGQLVTLLTDFGLPATLTRSQHSVRLSWESTPPLLLRFADTVPLRYTPRGQRQAAPWVEYLKTQAWKAHCYATPDLASRWSTYVATPHFNAPVDAFERRQIGKKIRVPLYAIEETLPEWVYDVTTRSANHSFLANGFVVSNCSHESPEGEACGLIKNLALTSYVRLGYPSQPILDVLRYHVRYILEASASDLQTGTWVFVNGTLWGVVSAADIDAFVQRLRRWRRIQDIPFSTSITHHQALREVHIVMDSGCCLRPVLVLENLHKFQTLYYQHRHNRYMLWDKMISNGVVEYLDKEEESTMRVATLWSDLKQPPHDPPFTHIELHPLTLLGISASFVPFANHDQAPRITYGSKSLTFY